MVQLRCIFSLLIVEMGALLSRSEKQGFTFSSSVHVDSSSKRNKKPIRKSMIGKPADFIVSFKLHLTEDKKLIKTYVIV